MTCIEKHEDGLSLIIVSDTGSAHSASGTPNQDAGALCSDHGNFVLAIADGVGSCRNAKDGAELAVKICMDIFEDILCGALPLSGSKIVSDIIARWHQKLCPETENDYCTTLKAAMHVRGTVIILSIGDGFIAAASGSKCFLLAGTQRDFSSETDCLCSGVKDDMFSMQVFELQPGEKATVFCCTDGVANGLIPGSEPDIVRELEAEASGSRLREQLEALIAELAQYSFDDRTAGAVIYEQQT